MLFKFFFFFYLEELLKSMLANFKEPAKLESNTQIMIKRENPKKKYAKKTLN